MRFPVPKGVLRIHFLEAHELLGKDKFLGGLIKGKSDPYGVLQVGTQLFQSKVVHETVNPKWNEVYEALIYDSSTAKNLELELFDEDTDKDDFLGSLVIDLAELQKEQKVDEWFILDEVSQGKLHLKLEWLSLLPKPDLLDQVLSSIRADRGHANDGLSSAVLVVFLDSARNLPTGKKVTSEPSPFVLFNVGHKSFESKTRYKTNEPVWEEAFTFLIHNPKTQELEVEVRDEKHECSLGKLSVSLTTLMDAPDMTLNKSFPLRSSGPTCSLKMKLALRVLCLEKDTTPSNGLPSAVQVRKSSSTPRPSISSDSGLPNHSDPASVSSQTGAELHNGRNQSSLNLNAKEPTPSIASDISNPYAAQELQYRLSQLPNGSAHFPLGEIQLTLRHSSQRNRLIVVVHSCR
uniref:C2 domain-containing protein n=1 Tax=Knipowitschia caucasica TaxID=637954 RepID=A0AAV2JYV2_KNICA